jgi:hypothetical protein
VYKHFATTFLQLVKINLACLQNVKYNMNIKELELKIKQLEDECNSWLKENYTKKMKLDLLEEYLKGEKNWKCDIIENRDEYELDFDDIIEIMQSEAQIPSNNKMYPFNYTNSVNDHCTDSLRCCSYVILQVIERGYNLDKPVKSLVSPSKLYGTRFYRGKKNSLKRRR